MRNLDALLAVGAPPLVAILRGVEPEEAVAVATAVFEGGICAIEIPLNSPDPFTSIALVQRKLGGEALIGAGTVLDVTAAEALAATGARLLVAPNCEPAVIARGIELGLEVLPGVLTPTEAFAAIAAGARRLKLFPGSLLGPGYARALREVLPENVGLWAVGGAGADSASQWFAAGIEGLGIGGSLYKAGYSPAEVKARARDLVAAVVAARAT